MINKDDPYIMFIQMKMVSIPIAAQSKCQFITEGKASNTFCKHLLDILVT